MNEERETMKELSLEISTSASPRTQSNRNICVSYNNNDHDLDRVRSRVDDHTKRDKKRDRRERGETHRNSEAHKRAAFGDNVRTAVICYAGRRPANPPDPHTNLDDDDDGDDDA